MSNAALETILSQSKEVAERCLELCFKVVSNILSNQADPKYRRLKTTNAKVSSHRTRHLVARTHALLCVRVHARVARASHRPSRHNIAAQHRSAARQPDTPALLTCAGGDSHPVSGVRAPTQDCAKALLPLRFYHPTPLSPDLGSTELDPTVAALDRAS